MKWTHEMPIRSEQQLLIPSPLGDSQGALTQKQGTSPCGAGDGLCGGGPPATPSLARPSPGPTPVLIMLPLDTVSKSGLRRDQLRGGDASRTSLRPLQSLEFRSGLAKASGHCLHPRALRNTVCCRCSWAGDIQRLHVRESAVVCTGSAAVGPLRGLWGCRGCLGGCTWACIPPHQCAA